MSKKTPPMTAHKAHWTAIATALSGVVLALTGVMPFDVQNFSADLSEALTLLAAIFIQAAVAWVTAYYKRNHLK